MCDKMRMADSYRARKELEIAIGRVEALHRELETKELDLDTKFAMCWDLGFNIYDKLEEFRRA